MLNPLKSAKYFSGRYQGKIADISRSLSEKVTDIWRLHILPIFFLGLFFRRVIPSFRPRFAGKCDRQSRDLTQLTGGYISRLDRLLITPRSSCSNSHLRKHSSEIFNGEFFILYQESISDTFASNSNAFSTELCLLIFNS